MKIGILSDTHNDAQMAQKALQEFRRRGIEMVFHCGDLTTDEMVPHFEGFAAHFVRGNMDRHQVKALKKAMAKQSGAHWLGKGKEVEVDGRRIAITHGDSEAVYEDLLNAKPDYLFVGHTHRRSDQQIGPTRVINPGALGGVEYEARSIGILDLVSGQLEVVHLS